MNQYKISWDHKKNKSTWKNPKISEGFYSRKYEMMFKTYEKFINFDAFVRSNYKKAWKFKNGQKYFDKVQFTNFLERLNQERSERNRKYVQQMQLKKEGLTSPYKAVFAGIEPDKGYIGKSPRLSKEQKQKIILKARAAQGRRKWKNTT